MCSDDFLTMCLQWKTQNLNEANNKINGTKCPKMVSLHTNVLDMDVNAAVNQFNYACFVIFFENGQRIHYDLVLQLTKLMTVETEI